MASKPSALLLPALFSPTVEWETLPLSMLLGHLKEALGAHFLSSQRF